MKINERRKIPTDIITRMSAALLAALVLASLGYASALSLGDPALENCRRYFRRRALPLRKTKDLDPLIDAVGDRRFVLLGESTHGTREYYRWRDKITRRLISEKGFSFVAVEGDWRAIYRLNEFVKHRTADTPDEVMKTLSRWPRWMWANKEFADFLKWLREYNSNLAENERVGVFGLDMQDPEDSMEAVLRWFRGNDPDNLAAVEKAYDAIRARPDGFRDYARGLARGERPVADGLYFAVGLLRDMMSGDPLDKELWAVKQDALAVKRAEKQYRALLFEGPNSWNARASFMHESFLRIAARHGTSSRGIVWAHNTHVGDANFTQMADHGQVNIGGLLRRSEGEDKVFITGFAASGGTVIAASAWGSSMQKMKIAPPRPDSYEYILRAAGLKSSLLIFDEDFRQSGIVPWMFQRAVGVVYSPPAEAYVPTLITHRYDALIYIDETMALSPLEFE